MANKFFEDFPHKGSQVFQQVDQKGWVMSTCGDFQIVGQVLDPPNISGQT